MTGKSAKIIIITAFDVCNLQMLTMKNHLIPLSKIFNVKHRSKSKYQLLLPLARKLVEAGHVKINVDADKVNYRNIKRSELEIISDLRELIGQQPANAQAANSNDTKRMFQRTPLAVVSRKVVKYLAMVSLKVVKYHSIVSQ